MKKNYIFLIFGIFLVILVGSLYFINIPAPSKSVSEKYELIVE